MTVEVFSMILYGSIKNWFGFLSGDVIFVFDECEITNLKFEVLSFGS